MQRQDEGRPETWQQPSFRVEGLDKVQAWGLPTVPITVGLGTPPQSLYPELSSSMLHPGQLSGMKLMVAVSSCRSSPLEPNGH